MRKQEITGNTSCVQVNKQAFSEEVVADSSLGVVDSALLNSSFVSTVHSVCSSVVEVVVVVMVGVVVVVVVVVDVEVVSEIA